MQPMQMGRFLAQLRKEAGLTQEALGQALGVTNKTVSRWENGNYLPDLAMLQSISAYFQVSVDELICGARAAAPKTEEAGPSVTEVSLAPAPEAETAAPGATESLSAPKAGEAGPSAEGFPLAPAPEAGTAAPAAAAPDAFLRAERIAYWKQKWRREHRASLAVCILCCLLLLLYGAVRRQPLLLGGASLLWLLLFCLRRNRMMAYVEARVYAP